MNQNSLEGSVKNGAAAGYDFVDPDLDARRPADRDHGSAFDPLADGLTFAGKRIVSAIEQIGELVGQMTGGARRVAGTVDPFVHEAPYRSVAIAAGVGLILGLLIARPGPKVIYIKPRD